MKQPIRASFQRGYVLVPGRALQSKSLANAGWSLMTSEICHATGPCQLMITKLSPMESMGDLDTEGQRNSKDVLAGQQVVLMEMTDTR